MTFHRTLATGMMTAMMAIAASPLHAQPVDEIARESDGALSLPCAEGNWLVTLDIGSDTHAGTTTIKAENRRLMLDRIASAKGQHVVRRFVVHVHNATLGAVPLNAPGGDHVRLRPDQAAQRNWDDRLTLEVLGPGAAVRSVRVEPAHGATLFLVGDSMVTDHPAEPTASWGQMLPAMLDDTLAVANYAESGATLKSFLADLRLDKALMMMKPGDYLLIQFGHNDQKANWPQTYAEAGTTYRAYLAAYIAEARRRGVTPILVTSPERRNFDAAGHITPSLGEYPATMRSLSQELHVPLIDLNRASVTLYEALGPERAPAMFNEEGRDKTHYNNWGAWMTARIIADGLRGALPALAPHITVPVFDPAHPEPAAIAPSVTRSAQRPMGN
jgi:lysophospholipase L1-like esterase